MKRFGTPPEGMTLLALHRTGNRHRAVACLPNAQIIGLRHEIREHLEKVKKLEADNASLVEVCRLSTFPSLLFLKLGHCCSISPSVFLFYDDSFPVWH